LFTDIQGSTKLWEEHREAMNLALRRHDQLMRQAIQAHHGYVFKTIGDAFCVAFASATDAMIATLQAQQSLHAQNWGETLIKVRMGLHTGEAHEREGDYFGPTLNRTARLMSIGHGGQVLLSQATQQLLTDTLPESTNLKDLGFHRLKDLSQPEHVYQLVHPDLPQQFPTLHSLSYLANNLPAQTTRFIGREIEIQKIAQLLDKSRLVMLTGIGGTGKTRLSLQVAAERIEQYADGVWFVELAPVSQPSLVANAIADVLNVADLPGKSILDSLKEVVKRKDLLLVLDNCEHLVEACAQVVSELLKACPRVRILSSSREGLNLTGEALYAVPPLPLPQAGEKRDGMIAAPAVQLFVERAQAAKPNFELTDQNMGDIAEICRQLDGIPLALELAAARVQMMTLKKLAELLEDRFRLLTGGKRTALPHHQTLRATIDWSYDLLGEEEKKLLNRLSVFRGGFALEAAEQICSEKEVHSGWSTGLQSADILGLLTQLINKSLVEVDEQEEATRYRLLETVRQYGQEKLTDTGKENHLHEVHLEYFLFFAEKAEPQLYQAKQGEWLGQLHQDHDNLRAALGWALQQKRTEKALRLSGALGRFWFVQGHLAEGREWLKQALHQRDTVTKAVSAKALRWAGSLTRVQGDYEEAGKWLEQSLEQCIEAQDRRGEASALVELGIVARLRGDYAETQRLFDRGLELFRSLDDRLGIAWVLNHRAMMARHQGNLILSYSLVSESLQLYQALGDRQGIAMALNTRANVELDRKEHAASANSYREYLAICQELEDKRGIAMALGNLGIIALEETELAEARERLTQSLTIFRTLGDRQLIAYVLSVLARAFWAEGQGVLAAQVQGAVTALVHELKAPLQPDEQKKFDQTASTLQATLGDQKYREAFEAGQRLTLEEAITLALHPDSK
jgi:predicted ATPase/class 3 adenylate cyclase